MTASEKPVVGADRPARRSFIRRRKRLIKPRIQLRLSFLFMGIALCALLSQFVLLGLRLSQLAERMPSGGSYLVQEAPRILIEILLVSVVVLLPSVVAVGVLITFRIAGPLHRFEDYLSRIARGEELGPCRIREDDELQDLCRLINEALDATRGGARQAGDEAPLRKAG